MGPGLDPRAAPLRRCVSVALAYGRYLAGVIRATAFWGTVLLPLVIVASLATDLGGVAPGHFVVLVGLNVLCILLGREYRPGE